MYIKYKNFPNKKRFTSGNHLWIVVHPWTNCSCL